MTILVNRKLIGLPNGLYRAQIICGMLHFPEQLTVPAIEVAESYEGYVTVLLNNVNATISW